MCNIFAVLIKKNMTTINKYVAALNKYIYLFITLSVPGYFNNFAKFIFSYGKKIQLV